MGIDITAGSLDVASELARTRGAVNFSCVQADVLQLALKEKLSVVVATGVVHGLADPVAGIQQLFERLDDDGLLFIWAYHAIGEAHARSRARQNTVGKWGQFCARWRGNHAKARHIAAH